MNEKYWVVESKEGYTTTCCCERENATEEDILDSFPLSRGARHATENEIRDAYYYGFMKYIP